MRIYVAYMLASIFAYAAVTGCYDSPIPKEAYYPRKFKGTDSRQISFKAISERIVEVSMFRRVKKGDVIGYVEKREFQLHGLRNEKIIDYVYDKDLRLKGFIVNDNLVYQFDKDGNARVLGNQGVDRGIPLILEYTGEFEIDEAEALYPLE